MAIKIVLEEAPVIKKLSDTGREDAQKGKWKRVDEKIVL